MGIKKNVFASKSEQRNYRKLCRTWGKDYRIYHNLPFLNVFTPTDLVDMSDWRNLRPFKLTELEFNRLKKTSIDYTLCDQEDHPILCIEFDGLQEGFNIGSTYHPSELQGPVNPWRQVITELKLKVAHGSQFPFFVVGSKQFLDTSPYIKLTTVDGIIGEVLALRATGAKFAQGFDPNEIGYSQEEFDRLPEYVQHELVQDWVIDVEIEKEFEHNPISQKYSQLSLELDIRRWREEPLEYPPADFSVSLEERIKAFDSAIMYGARVTIEVSDFGDVQAEAWLPNFKVAGYSGFGLIEDIAFLLALEKLQKLRAGRASQKTRR